MPISAFHRSLSDPQAYFFHHNDNEQHTPNGKFASGNKIGAAGRPRGSKNKTTRAVEILLDGEGENITRKCVEMAISGDSVALRLCMERLLAPSKDRPVSIDLPRLTRAEHLPEAAAKIIEAVSQGEIDPATANRIMQLVEVSRRTIETEDLEKRLEKLEMDRGQ